MRVTFQSLDAGIFHDTRVHARRVRDKMGVHWTWCLIPFHLSTSQTSPTRRAGIPTQSPATCLWCAVEKIQ